MISHSPVMRPTDGSRHPNDAGLLPAVFLIFLLAFIIDPGGALGAKYATTLLAVFVLLATPAGIMFPRSFLRVEFLVFFILPLLGVAVAAARGNSAGGMFGAVTFALTWLIFPICLRLSRDRLIAVFERVMTIAALLFVAAYVLLYALLLSGRFELVAKITFVTSSLRLGYFGINPETVERWGNIPNVYFRWTLLLLPAIVLAAGRSRRRFCLMATACLGSLSTALIVFSAAALMALQTVRGLADRGTFVSIFLGVPVVVALAYFAPAALGLKALLESLIQEFSMRNVSVSVRAGHIESIVALLGNDPLTLIFGMGPGAEFFSLGVRDYVAFIEVSHLDVARQFGVLYLAVFCVYVVHLVVRLWRTDGIGQRLAIGIAGLFVAAGTNPLLLSPVFLIPIVIGRSYVYRFSKEDRP